MCQEFMVMDTIKNDLRVLQRRFSLLSLIAFTTAMMCTWESAIP